jgi:hypothetical protein
VALPELEAETSSLSQIMAGFLDVSGCSAIPLRVLSNFFLNNLSVAVLSPMKEEQKGIKAEQIVGAPTC